MDFKNPRWGRQARNFFYKCSENSRSQVVYRTDIFLKVMLSVPQIWYESVLKPRVTLCKFVYCKFQTVSNKTRPSNETAQRSVTDVVTMATEPATTSSLNKNANLYISKTVALPIWLIAVIAGGAVITTLAVTAIIWIYCKMRQRY